MFISVFRGAGLVRLRQQFINDFDFPTWASAAGFDDNNIIKINRARASLKNVKKS